MYLSRKDIEEALRLINDYFTCFGLTVHCGDKKNDGNFNTEVIFFSLQRRQQRNSGGYNKYINE